METWQGVQLHLGLAISFALGRSTLGWPPRSAQSALHLAFNFRHACKQIGMLVWLLNHPIDMAAVQASLRAGSSTCPPKPGLPSGRPTLRLTHRAAINVAGSTNGSAATVVRHSRGAPLSARQFGAARPQGTGRLRTLPGQPAC